MVGPDPAGLGRCRWGRGPTPSPHLPLPRTDCSLEVPRHLEELYEVYLRELEEGSLERATIMDRVASRALQVGVGARPKFADIAIPAKFQEKLVSLPFSLPSSVPSPPLPSPPTFLSLEVVSPIPQHYYLAWLFPQPRVTRSRLLSEISQVTTNQLVNPNT